MDRTFDRYGRGAVVAWSRADRTLTMISDSQRLPTMAERIERVLLLLAYFIELDGDVHVPLYERLEAELLTIQSREEVRERARQRLAAYSQAGALKAICSKNLSLSSSDGPLPYFGL